MNATVCDVGAVRRGSSLLWEPRALAVLGVPPEEIRPIRSLFELSSDWPEELPSCSGRVVVVSGMDACLDALKPEDAETWLEEDVREALLSFQDFYGGGAGLVFWLPSGGRRVRPSPAMDAWDWKCGAAASGRTLSLGRALWGGAERDARPLVLPADSTTGRAAEPIQVGLHHPRLS
jgi:hypothetical protein